jgi:hypothetical protein
VSESGRKVGTRVSPSTATVSTAPVAARPTGSRRVGIGGADRNRTDDLLLAKQVPVGIGHLDRRAHLRGEQAFRLSIVGGVLHSSAPSQGLTRDGLGASARRPRWFKVIDLTLIRDAMGSSHGVSKRSKSQLFQLEGVFDNAR